VPYIRTRPRFSRRGMGASCAWYDLPCWLMGNAQTQADLIARADAVTKAQQDASAWQGLNLTLTGGVPSAPPVLAPGAISPGLPVGYDPLTGTVSPDNMTGATDVNVFQASLPSAPVDLTSPSTWGLSQWLIAGMVGLGLFIVMQPHGARR